MKKTVLSLIAGLLAFQAGAEELKWLTDLPAAQALAKKEKKLVFVDFTGSDWCGWCVKLKKEVFDTKEFADYAKDNLILVELDFPRRKEQSAALKKANAALQEKHGVTGFPTLLALNADGKEVWKNPGYHPGGPAAMIAKLDAAKKK